MMAAPDQLTALEKNLPNNPGGVKIFIMPGMAGN